MGCPYCGGKMPKIEQDYHELASLHGIEWIGKFPGRTMYKTEWRCQSGHEWQATYSSVQQRHGCPICLDRVNGAPVSKPQRKLHEMANGELNYRVRRYSIDIALLPDKIAIEYDCAYYHDNDHDMKRDKTLIALGWRVLRVKSGTKLPTRKQLDIAIALLLSGETYTEIVLDDWKG